MNLFTSRCYYYNDWNLISIYLHLHVLLRCFIDNPADSLLLI